MDRFILSELPKDTKLPILIPTKAIANYLQISHSSLESLAQTTIRQGGWKIASAIFSRRLLSKLGFTEMCQAVRGAEFKLMPNRSWELLKDQF